MSIDNSTNEDNQVNEHIISNDISFDNPLSSSREYNRIAMEIILPTTGTKIHNLSSNKPLYFELYYLIGRSYYNLLRQPAMTSG